MSRLQWNQTEYASITGSFPLISRKEGKVTQIITAQTLPPDNYLRDLNFPVTHLHWARTTRRKSVTRMIQTSLSVNFEYQKSAVLVLLYVHPNQLVTDSSLFVNLPCSVSQSSNESETKVIETETAVRVFPCQTVGKTIWNWNMFQALQSNQVKAVQSKLWFLNPIFCCRI